MKQAWPLAFGFAVIVFSGVGAAAYTRPPPGRILTVKSSESDSHPQQVRISIVGSDHMRISWITKDKNIPSLVEYGKTPDVYDSSASGESTSYRFFFYTSDNIHHVEIGPLDAHTTYYYRCGGVGEEFTFKTPPSTLPIEFVLIGDLGQTEWTASTLSHINYSDYDILLLPGDRSYADSQQPLWDSFALLKQPEASRRPWMVTQGNHEVESLFPIFRIHPFTAYNARWRMPFEQSSSTSNLFYSFDAAGGEAHVLMLGSYAEYGVKSQQYKWLKADLAKLLEHILLHPDTYFGSVEKHTQTLWVYENAEMVHRPVTHVPELYKIFDEILGNVADNKLRDPSINSLKVDIDAEANCNNGDGVPVEIYQEERKSFKYPRLPMIQLHQLDRTKTPWLLANVHAPWYNTNDAYQREGEGMRKAVEKLLFDAKVDIVFVVVAEPEILFGGANVSHARGRDSDVKLEYRSLKEKMKDYNKKVAKFYGNMFAEWRGSNLLQSPMLFPKAADGEDDKQERRKKCFFIYPEIQTEPL
ncbi:hypothetical protein IEQ34_021428 [Dendrobium chrysotoxum]|uniref:Purple acid phosphatase n=1 Tax=Dendrobium chrysotoxum TaxID=161865 RepID=A0AAV7G2X1_DENCH|nr:hypothetical protein IEQ34_021428 [Dendrobium chrysotoxum]